MLQKRVIEAEAEQIKPLKLSECEENGGGDEKEKQD